LSAESIAGLRRRFDDTHKQMFGHTAPAEPVEIVSYRLRGVGRVPQVKLPAYKPAGRNLKDALIETRRARFNGETVDCPVYRRDLIDVGVGFKGPAIVEQLDATAVIPIGRHARVDNFKNILNDVANAS
jgi:N-methylhydantoinase A